MSKNLGKYDQIKNMSINELKDEYYNCSIDDQVKKQIIKKLIKSKNTQKKDKKVEVRKDTDITNLTEKINKSIDKLFSLKKNVEYCEKTETKTKEKEPIKKIGIDYSNNKLMERLNCELDFRVYGTKPSDIDNIIKPYAGVGNNNGNIFKDFPDQIDNFLNK